MCSQNFQVLIPTCPRNPFEMTRYPAGREVAGLVLDLPVSREVAQRREALHLRQLQAPIAVGIQRVEEPYHGLAARLALLSGGGAGRGGSFGALVGRSTGGVQTRRRVRWAEKAGGGHCRHGQFSEDGEPKTQQQKVLDGATQLFASLRLPAVLGGQLLI